MAYVKRVEDKIGQYSVENNNKIEQCGPCIYYIGSGKDLISITIYVNYILVSLRNKEMDTKAKDRLSKENYLKKMGNVSYCLGNGNFRRSWKSNY